MAIIPNTEVFLPTEVRDVLNSAGGSVTDDTLTFFTKAANINKWARYKPESYPQDAAMSEHERKLNNFGFDVSSMAGIVVPTLIEMARSGNTWKYILPSGGKNSPFRLGDFRGYNTEAKPPFDYHWISRSGATTTGTYTDEWRVVVNGGSEIKMSDLAVLDNMSANYFLFIAKHTDGTYVKSSVVSRDGDPEEIICSITLTKTGVWECMFCVGQNLSEEIEARTDLAVMPEGYFTFELSTKAIYVRATYVSPNPPEVSFNASTGVLNFGTTYFFLTLKANDESEAVPSTVLQFGWYMALYDSSGNMLGDNEVYATDGADEKTYTGTDEVGWNTVNFPQFVNLSDYFGETEIANAAKIVLRPSVRTVSGSGIPTVDIVSFEYDL